MLKLVNIVSIKYLIFSKQNLKYLQTYLLYYTFHFLHDIGRYNLIKYYLLNIILIFL